MKKLFNQVYKGKKVLITGHTGFKGSWLTLWLKLIGAEIVGYSLPPPTKPSLFEILNLEKEIIHVIGDVRDEDKLLETFRKYKPEIVIHMAAQPLVRYSYLNPKETYETNVIGTLNLFECVRKTESVRVVINVTSDKCYKNEEWVYGYRENDPMGGYDPYSSSKGCAELLTTAYRNSFFNPQMYGKTHNVSLASTRAGNVIAGGDWAEDILTVEELVKQVLELWGKGSYIVNPDSNLYEAKLLKLDISKARFLLKWKPTYNIQKALEETISWYKTFYLQKDKDILTYTINQIEKYVNTAKLQNTNYAKEG